MSNSAPTELTEPLQADEVSSTRGTPESCVWSPGRILCAVMAILLSGCTDIEGIAPGESETTETTDRPVGDVQVYPADVAMTVAQQLQLASVVVDVDGRVLDRDPAWSTGDDGVAIVDSTGLVTGVGVGSTEVAASSGGRSGSTPVVVSVPGGFHQIASGVAHTCGISSDGAPYCWGDPESGRLGVGTVVETPSDPQSRPAPLQGGWEFSRVTAGVSHSCALDTSGRAFCWGRNFFGSLGNGDEAGESHNVPISAAAGITLSGLVTGGNHTCGVEPPDGVAYCWGANHSGQVGDGGESPEVYSAVPVVGGLAFDLVATGSTHTCGIAGDGDGYCWGSNGYGELGTGQTGEPGDRQPTPQPVTGDLTFTSLTLGGSHGCGLVSDGTAYCWGLDGDGQLGSGGTTAGACVNPEGDQVSCTASPQHVTGGLTFRALSAGGRHTCGITVGGETYCWGLNDQGQLGLGASSDPVLEPTPIDSDLVFDSVAAGTSHTCAVNADEVAYCWGSNDRGQLGDGTLDDRAAPVRVLGQG